MSNRVFSYNNWNLFCGFDPTYTKIDKIKLQTIDGTNVETIGDQFLLTNNPLEGIGIIPHCATRENDGADISIEQLINDGEMIAEIYTYMVNQAIFTSTDFCTLAYLDDAKKNKGFFALVSICDYNEVDCVVYYKTYTMLPIVSISKSMRSEMLNHKLPSIGRFIPNGLCVENTDIAVFSMSPDIAIECMIDINPNMHFGLTSANVELINQYIQNTINNVDDDEADDIADAYYELCRHALTACSQTKSTKFITSESSIKHKVIKKQETIIRAKQYLILHNKYVAALDQIKNLQETNNQQNQTIENLEKHIGELLTQAKNEYNNENLFYQLSAEYSKQYAYLEQNALESLINAEFLYRVHADHKFMDFAPIILEFSKALEIQLLKHLKDKKPETLKYKMLLGDIIKAIDENKIAPYHKSKEKYRLISRIRGESAHVDPKTKEDADKIRNMFYEENVLSGLK